ncbi:MAG TPA: hypothetical protein VLA96_00045 [Terriglobales bacterium]|jgi:hypothetical protein|nr:hypothetical protein [Terriglobales bacterium]
MRTLRFLAVSLCLFAAVSLVAQEHRPKPVPNAAFDRLKTLAGDWKGKYVGPEGTFEGMANFKVVSAGSAMMLSMDEHNEATEMITMFHPDGEKQLMATHYCSGQNQPRMRLTAMPDASVLEFDFVDGTNLRGGHMKKLVITIVDADHHVQTWSYDDGKGNMTTAKMEYTRVKS